MERACKPADGAAFGFVQDRPARLYTIENSELRACVTDYAGVLVSVETRDRHGEWGHVALGFDSVAGYVENKGSFGALLGRNANRIACGAFTLDGVTYALSRNENGNTLHGGVVGFSKRFWTVTAADRDAVTLALTSADGDQGFPGAVTAEAEYRLAQNSLSLRFSARTTRATPLSLSSHPYFNLDFPQAEDCLSHSATLHADKFLPTDAAQIPSGEIRAVAGTPFDFTTSTVIGARIRKADAQLRFGKGYDHYFVLPAGRRAAPQWAARIAAPRSGRVLDILTTQPGFQFYTGNNLDGAAYGRGGAYRQSAGFAIEPQGFPDAVNQPAFPTTVLRPGETYAEETIYRFSVEPDSRRTA